MLEVEGQEVARSYTPVSSAKDYKEGRLEVMVKVYATGKLTPRLAELSTDGTVMVSRPLQTLNPADYPQGIVVIAGGSAVTVALQICRAVLARCSPKDLVHLVLCNRTPEDALYQESFQEMIVSNPAFKVVHCLSEGPLPPTAPADVATWLLGRISVKAFAGFETFPLSRAAISGPPGLCAAAMALLKQQGMPEAQIRVLDELPKAVPAMGPALPEEAPIDGEAAMGVVRRRGASPGSEEEAPPAVVDTRPRSFWSLLGSCRPTSWRCGVRARDEDEGDVDVQRVV